MKLRALLTPVLFYAVLIMTGSQGKSAPTDTIDFRVEKINDHILAFIAPPPTGLIVDGNSYAIITKAGVLVVDARRFGNIARKTISEIRKQTNQPVRWLFNTHWHGDHNMGNSVFRDSFPQVNIITQEATREVMARRMPAIIQRAQDGQLSKLLPNFDSILIVDTFDDGTPISAFNKAQAKEAIFRIKRNEADNRLTKLELPNLTFADQMIIHADTVEIQLRHAMGNTPGDAIVWLPKEQILFTGDLVVSPVPYGIGSFHTEWLEALDTIIALNPKIILPGHGQPMRDLGYIKMMRGALADLVGQVRREYKKGVTANDSVLANMDMSKWKSQMVKGDPNDEFAYNNYFLNPAVDRELKLLKGEIGSPDPSN